ncbi:hypothetical protein SRABI128_06127 [Microbacterium sp. Bi128]|nr:hypothetical protein SRABI128_06127 [Microbacterium sp. Bi128]
MVGPLGAEVRQAPVAELDTRPRAEDAAVAAASLDRGATAADDVEAVQHVLVVALVADLGMHRREAGQPQVGIVAGPDHGLLGQQVELARGLAVPVARPDREDQARTARPGRVVGRRDPATHDAVHGRHERQRRPRRHGEAQRLSGVASRQQRRDGTHGSEPDVRRTGDDALQQAALDIAEVHDRAVRALHAHRDPARGEGIRDRRQLGERSASVPGQT